MADNEAAVLAERLRAAAEAIGAHLVEGHVRTGSASTIPEVYLEMDAALALISVAKPRVIYVDETLLEFEDLLVEARELLRLGEDDETPAALRAAAAPLSKHAGEHCSASAHFVVDSILHSTATSASWMEEFDSQLADLVSAAREASIGDRERASAVEAAHVEALARRLLADPAFHFGKVSAAKRHLLATAMFPDEEAIILDDVVDLAQRLDWLNQSGFEGVANR
jgi:hypothetical protein